MAEIPVRYPRWRRWPRVDWKLLGTGLVGLACLFVVELVALVISTLGPEPARSRWRAFRQRLAASDREMREATAEMQDRIRLDPKRGPDEIEGSMGRLGDRQGLAEIRAARARAEKAMREMNTPLGILREHAAEPREAIDALRAYRDKHPHDYHAWAALAQAWWQAGHIDESLDAQREAARLADAGGEEPWVGAAQRLELGMMLADAGRRTEAGCEFRRVIREAPGDSYSLVRHAYLRLGDVYRLS